MEKRHRSAKRQYCVTCGTEFVAKRIARYCGVRCRVFAHRNAVPFSNVDTLPDCPWDLFTRVGSWYLSGFQDQWFAWASQAWAKSGARVSQKEVAIAIRAVEIVKLEEQ